MTDSTPYAPAVRAVCQQFDALAASVLISLPEASAVSRRSRSSLYRAFASGELPRVKVGSSTRIRVGDLRRLIGV